MALAGYRLKHVATRGATSHGICFSSTFELLLACIIHPPVQTKQTILALLAGNTPRQRGSTRGSAELLPCSLSLGQL